MVNTFDGCYAALFLRLHVRIPALERYPSDDVATTKNVASIAVAQRQSSDSYRRII